MLEIGERKPLVTPAVTYDPEVRNGNLPYSATVDPHGCTRVLRFLEVPEPEIALLKINISEKPSLGAIFELGSHSGSYNPRENKISLYTNHCWRKYKNLMETARKIVSGKQKPFEGFFRDELYTERLEDFLLLAPSERAMQTASRLFRVSLQRWFNWTALHELRHVSQYSNCYELSTKKDIDLQSEAVHFSGDFHQKFPRVAVITPISTPLI